LINLLPNCRIGTRLAFCFSLVIALMLLVYGLNAQQATQVRSLSSEVTGAQAERLSLATLWHYDVAVNSQRVVAIGVSASRTLEKEFAADIKKVIGANQQGPEAIRQTRGHGRGHRLAAEGRRDPQEVPFSARRHAAEAGAGRCGCNP
jgi:hypothetical protein